MCSDVKNLEFILEKIETIVKIHLPKLKTDIESILLELKGSEK